MSTIPVAAILLLSIAGLVFLFVALEKKKARKKSLAHLKAFHEAGSKYELSFSSQEVLRDKIIGLDGIKNTLLVLEFENTHDINVIPMAEVKSCTLKKEYESVSMSDDKNGKAEQILRFIGLEFIHKKNNDPVFVSFYDHIINNVYETAELEAKAKTWELMLSKLLVKELRVRA